eukprot:m.72568 g.72568  ORF g.72568 m.72568 type:complete len:323 (-) comp16107_c1_seq1:69-1037(-)
MVENVLSACTGPNKNLGELYVFLALLDVYSLDKGLDSAQGSNLLLFFGIDLEDFFQRSNALVFRHGGCLRYLHTLFARLVLYKYVNEEFHVLFDVRPQRVQSNVLLKAWTQSLKFLHENFSPTFAKDFVLRWLIDRVGMLSPLVGSVCDLSTKHVLIVNERKNALKRLEELCKVDLVKTVLGAGHFDILVSRVLRHWVHRTTSRDRNLATILAVDAIKHARIAVETLYCDPIAANNFAHVCLGCGVLCRNKDMVKEGLSAFDGLQTRQAEDIAAYRRVQDQVSFYLEDAVHLLGKPGGIPDSLRPSSVFRKAFPRAPTSMAT